MQPIGILDSGIGGLTIARAIANRLPNVPMIYFGDTQHLPYGEKSPELIRSYAQKIALHLKEQGCQVIVVACNSASSNALDVVREAVGPGIPVIDVLFPVVDSLSSRFREATVGVIGTRATIASQRYQQRLTENGFKVVALATPLLASAIEEGFYDGAVSGALLATYLGQNTFNDVDALILGCTHYPLIAEQISDFLPETVEIINSAEVVAEAVAETMGKEESSNGVAQPPRFVARQFLVSDLTISFAQSAQRFFGDEVELEERNLWSL
jgi:glutamate racemase